VRRRRSRARQIQLLGGSDGRSALLRCARRALVDALAKDPSALLVALDARELEAAVGEAAALFASVTGQDLDEGEDATLIARRVARDRIISTVDPDARDGHKIFARGFDGYKGHVSVDPDLELIVATALTGAHAGDAAAAGELLADDLAAPARRAGGGRAPG